MIGAGAPFLLGPLYPSMTVAIANSVQIYTVGLVTVITTNVGIGPAGTGIGAIINSIMPILKSSLDSTFIANGMLGEHSPNLTRAIAIAVSSGLASAITLSPVLGVGVGTGIGKLVHPGPIPLLGLLTSQFFALGLVGEKTPLLAKAIAEGYTQFLDTLIVVHSIAGSPIPPTPGVVPSIGKII
jgi:hypothetical protein